jgi:hypothetical protein
MSTEDEIKEIVAILRKKENLKAYEKQFLDVYDKKTCDEELIKELQLKGLNKYIERNLKNEFNELNKSFVSDIKDQGKSLKGKWTDVPPSPPPLPSDCCIM